MADGRSSNQPMPRFRPAGDLQHDIDSFHNSLERRHIGVWVLSSFDAGRNAVNSRGWTMQDDEPDLTILMGLDEMGEDTFANIAVMSDDSQSSNHSASIVVK